MNIDFTSWEKVDIYSGTIVKVEEFPRAQKPAYKVSVDFGNKLGVKRTSAQITVNYFPQKNCWERQCWEWLIYHPKILLDLFLNFCFLG